MREKLLFFLFIFTATLLIAQEGKTLSNPEVTFTFVSKKVTGSISGFTSSSKVDTNNLLNSKFKGTVATETLSTGNFLRNWSLKGSTYFDSDTYPTIGFESTGITENEKGFIAHGLLTMKGITKSIDITFVLRGNRLLGTTSLNTSDFNIKVIKKNRADNKVEVTLSFLII